MTALTLRRGCGQGQLGVMGRYFHFWDFFPSLQPQDRRVVASCTVSRCKALACVERITTTKSGREDPMTFVTNLSTSLGQRANLTGSEPRYVLQRGTEREGEKGRESGRE